MRRADGALTPLYGGLKVIAASAERMGGRLLRKPGGAGARWLAPVRAPPPAGHRQRGSPGPGALPEGLNSPAMAIDATQRASSSRAAEVVRAMTVSRGWVGGGGARGGGGV